MVRTVGLEPTATVLETVALTIELTRAVPLLWGFDSENARFWFDKFRTNVSSLTEPQFGEWQIEITPMTESPDCFLAAPMLLRHLDVAS